MSSDLSLIKMSSDEFLESFGEHKCFNNLNLNDSFSLVEFLVEVHNYNGINSIPWTNDKHKYIHDGSNPIWFYQTDRSMCYVITLADISDDFGLTAFEARQAKIARYNACGSMSYDSSDEEKD
jgi:hypothetical protein